MGDVSGEFNRKKAEEIVQRHPAVKARFERDRLHEVLDALKLITTVKPLAHKAQRMELLLDQMEGNNGVAAQALLKYCRQNGVEYSDVVSRRNWRAILELLKEKGLKDDK